MCHPLYPVASRLVGSPVIAHHISGRAYSGTLHTVTQTGIYLLPHGGRVSYVHGVKQAVVADTALESSYANHDLVWFPGAYFAFGTLAGLGLGLAAGSAWGRYYW